MNTVLRNLQDLIKKEEKLGFTDAAVFGGFSHFMDREFSRLLPYLPEAEHREIIFRLQKLVVLYRESSWQERSAILKQILMDVNRLSLSTQLKPDRVSLEKPEIPRLATPVQYLKNVGPKRAALFQRLGVRTVADLLEYYPKRYEDRRLVKKIDSLEQDSMVTVQGRIIRWEEIKPRSNLSIIKAWITDGSGTLPAVWFNQRFVKKNMPPGTEIIVYGKVEEKFYQTEILVQDFETAEADDTLAGARIVPVYGGVEKLPQKIIRKVMFQAVEKYAGLVTELIPEPVRERLNLIPKPQAVREIHFPKTMEEKEEARYRLSFEELFLLQLGILFNGAENNTQGISHHGGNSVREDFQKVLPFQLTKGQERAINEIFAEMEAPHPMARLVQGDVGSGKTVVAAAALFKAVRSGYQGALMAPTEILAEQHYRSLKSLLGKLGCRLALLTGSTPVKEREVIYAGIAAGEIDIVIGTHALIQSQVSFRFLSLAVTDEQHRFGVRQRAELQNKGVQPDVLVMTATPIPRSLALTLYGDLNLSVIDELPPGRKPVKTYAVTYDLEKRILAFIKKEVLSGRQAYIVCPLVEESEKLDLQAAKELSLQLAGSVFRGIPMALLHGKMKPKEKEKVMEDFYLGSTKILVSTTVIEVGINVPNATVMVVRDAERFGLAQLHQLRGRIGRGEHRSFCILMHQAKTPEGRERMKIMETTSDGFRIAEADLTLRGPGDFFGTRQHGLPELKIANIFMDAGLLEPARREAMAVLEDDPGLEKEINEPSRKTIREKFQIN